MENSHFLADELQPAVDGTLGLDLVLLEQYGPDELEDLLTVFEFVELALDAEVFGFLSLELLASGDGCLQF